MPNVIRRILLKLALGFIARTGKKMFAILAILRRTLLMT